MKRFNHAALKSTLLVLLAFSGVTAIIIGLLLMLYPNGSAFNLSENVLAGTPIQDLHLPGLLLIFVGLFNLGAFLVYFKSNKIIYNWAQAAAGFLILWMLGMFVFIPSYYMFYIFYMVIGLLIILISVQLKGKAIV